MSNNFDVHAWKRNRLIESTLEDADLKAKKRVDVISNSVLKSFPELNKLELRYAISSGFSDLVFDGLLEAESNEKEYEVEYWIYRNDDYEDDEVTVKASSEEEALEKAKNSVRRGKNFKVIGIDGKLINENEENPIDTITTDVPLFIRLLEYAKEDAETDMDLHNVAENAIRLSNNSSIPLTMDDYNNIINQESYLPAITETINFILENIEGYSKYFPGGKTKGLDKDTLSTILMQIIKDTEEDGKQLDESNLCKRGQDYIKSRKAAGEKSSAYLSGRAVKVCKGQINGSDGKKKKSY